MLNLTRQGSVCLSRNIQTGKSDKTYSHKAEINILTSLKIDKYFFEKKFCGSGNAVY
jgi:hypothetical protein